MKKKTTPRYNSTLISYTAYERSKEFRQESNKIRQKREEEFFNRSFDIQDVNIAPAGYEGPMLLLYAAIIPYLAGLAFLFFYVAETQFEFFVEFSLTSIFVIWAIGYEVCAALLIGGILLAWARHLTRRGTKQEPPKRRNGRNGF